MVPTLVPARLSVVAPARNEENNLRGLVEEIEAALDPLGVWYEIIIVDDGSSDRTPEILADLVAGHDRLRALRMTERTRGRGNGQSAAFHAGFRVARGDWVVTMDADRQNDPADIAAMLSRLDDTDADMVQGDRSRGRKDAPLRRVSSWVGRLFRRVVLGDTIRDTGCSLRVMRHEVALALPLEFQGMHRFIPVTARQMGYTVIEMPVTHRPRVAGRPNYGVWDRARAGIFDCLAVRWMRSRRRSVAYDVTETIGGERADGDGRSRRDVTG